MADFSFGIVTNSQDTYSPYLERVVQSIRDLLIPNYEIIIVGTKKNISVHGPDIKVIDFDEDIRRAWITRKKNIITENAKYNNIVYQHDYIVYDSGWYQAWKDFKYDVGMNPIQNVDGTRYRDWSIFPQGGLVESLKKILNYHEHCYEYLLPYTETGMSALQYISGAWWVAKKHVMQEFKLNESLMWGQGEDVDWSYKVRKKYKFSINTEASVSLLKYNSVAFTLIQDENLEKVRDFLRQKGLYD